MKRKPGYKWRLLAHHDNGRRVQMGCEPVQRICFDELVVDDWLHIEQMDTRSWWMSLAGLTINVQIPHDGQPRVLIELDDPERMGELRNLAPASSTKQTCGTEAASAGGSVTDANAPESGGSRIGPANPPADQSTTPEEGTDV